MLVMMYTLIVLIIKNFRIKHVQTTILRGDCIFFLCL